MSPRTPTPPPAPRAGPDPDIEPIVGSCDCQEYVYDTAHDKGGDVLIARPIPPENRHSPKACECRCHSFYKLMNGAML